MTNAIEVQGLVRAFGAHTAVDGLDWIVPRGAACAILGPNGAGKSTTLRILAGLISAHGGEARVLGLSPWERREALASTVAFMPEAPFLPDWMTLKGLRSLNRSLYLRWDDGAFDELVQRFEVPLNQKIGALSKGQNRRAHLILTLSQGAELLLLDEPASGLDVEGRREMLRALSEWMADDATRTIVLSTHVVTDVERFANHVTVIDGGTVRADEDLDDLQLDVKSVEMRRATYEKLRVSVDASGVLSTTMHGDHVSLIVRRFRALDPALRTVGPGDVTVSEGESSDVYMASDGNSILVSHLSLEDTYLSMTKAGVEGPGGLR